MGKIVWLKNWSHSHRKIKKKIKEPMSVYVIIFLIAISYVSIENIGKISISGFVTSEQPSQPIQATPTNPTYTPPDTSSGDCGAPCPLGSGEIGVCTKAACVAEGDCIPIKKYYDEKHCCVDWDCPVGMKCSDGICK